MKQSHAKSRLILAALPLLWQLGCQSAPTRTYTLFAVPGSVSKEYAGPPVRVEDVHMPASIDRPEIMLDISQGQLKISDLDHWSAPLGPMARQTLSQDLILRLPPGKTIFPRLPKPSGALGVSVDILEFQTDHGNSRLTASWIISPRAAGAPIPGTPTSRAAAGGTASLSIANTTDGALGTVQALSALLGQLADRIVADL